MEKVSRDNPSDTEARIFYALAVAQTAPPTDKTYAKNLKAAAILEPLFAQMPTHPGLAHYIIHAYDAPPLADKALVAARKYASLAPAIPHALHMPSHTFTRVGSWQESIDTNRRSADAARKSNGAGEELHALDYQTYAYLQIAQDHGRQGRARSRDEVDVAPGGKRSRQLIRDCRHPRALRARARQLGRCRRADPDSGEHAVIPKPSRILLGRSARRAAASRRRPRADIERLAALRDKEKELKDAYWTEQIDIQRRVALAWQAFATGNKDEGIAQLSAAADAEDLTDKSAISPGPLAPARELLGYMLLDAGKAKEALVAFELTMKKEPNRFRGIYGGALAAEALRDRAKATTYYKSLLDVAKDADTQRPELARAKKYVGGV